MPSNWLVDRSLERIEVREMAARPVAVEDEADGSVRVAYLRLQTQQSTFLDATHERCADGPIIGEGAFVHGVRQIRR